MNTETAAHEFNALAATINDASLDAHSLNVSGLRVKVMNAISDTGQEASVDLSAAIDPIAASATVTDFREACRTAVRIILAS